MWRRQGSICISKGLEVSPFCRYALVTVVASAADPYAVTNAFMHPKWLLATMSTLGLPESWITKLGLLKQRGRRLACQHRRAIGCSRWPIQYFVAAILTHPPTRDNSFGPAVGFLQMAVASQVVGTVRQGPVALAVVAR
jgi:hypothetical protein